jgi:hypothetical protein
VPLNKKSLMQTQEENIKNEKKQNTDEGKYVIQTLDIKEDTNMTRIYSVIYKPGFFSQEVNQDKR